MHRALTILIRALPAHSAVKARARQATQPDTMAIRRSPSASQQAIAEVVRAMLERLANKPYHLWSSAKAVRHASIVRLVPKAYSERPAIES
jgi:hypothetical protein